ncbi:MAG: cobalt-zinc-cadmium efflux system outer membrane protein, partial [Pirellulaceae bacterium]
MAMRTSFPVCLLIVALIAALIGCQSTDHVRHPDYAELVNSVHHSYHSPLSAVEAIAPESPQFEGPHSVEEYIQFALLQNPKIHAARKRMEAMAHQVPVAASLPDPTLSLTVQPEPVQTASGQQELILAANQKFHWFGKLETRASVAESQTDVARAQLAAEELATISQVKQAYYELYFVQQAIDVTTAEQRLLGEIRDVANSRYKTGQTSQQDVLRAELEISNVETELIRLRQKLKSVQARLARLLHISPQTAVLATNELPPEQVPQDLDRLQQQAVAARPELHAHLAAIERDQRAVALARLDYKPDVTLGLSWVDVASGGISPVANG